MKTPGIFSCPSCGSKNAFVRKYVFASETQDCYCKECETGWIFDFTKLCIVEKKEATTTKVSYSGFTGELVKLERSFCRPEIYDLSIYDSEKQVTHSFTGVKVEDVKFLGGAVTFGG